MSFLTDVRKRRLNPGAHLQRFALAQELPLHSDPVLSDGRRLRWSLFAARARLWLGAFTVAFAAIVVVSCGGSKSGSGRGQGDPSADANWRLFGHDYHNTRANTAETTIGVDNVDQLELLWEHVTVQSTSTPAVVDDIVYYADWSGMLYAKDADDGSEVWTTELQGGTTASPAVTEDKVFVGGGGAACTRPQSARDGGRSPGIRNQVDERPPRTARPASSTGRYSASRKFAFQGPMPVTCSTAGPSARTK
jgi:hypothetical protein